MKNTVNLDKALADLENSDTPSTPTDIAVFKCMAGWAAEDGSLDLRTREIADLIGRSSSAVAVSARRLEDKGLIRIGKVPTPRSHGRVQPMNRYAIAPAYMLDAPKTPETPKTTETPTACDAQDLAAAVQRATLAYIGVLAATQAVYAERFDKLAKQLGDIAQAIKDN